MATQSHSESLYGPFGYSELEAFVSKVKDKAEREFCARLCDFYIAKNQSYVMREKPL